MEMGQKAEEEWLIFGDKCSKLFHKFLKAKKNRKAIYEVEDYASTRRVGQGEIVNSFVQYFFNSLGTYAESSLLKEILDNLNFLEGLSFEQQELITTPVTDEEIREAFFSINSRKSLGPDGMSCLFFKCMWETIQEDVCKAIKHIFTSRRILGGVNSTHICLIPKTFHPVKVDEFIPIACCNIVDKAI